MVKMDGGLAEKERAREGVWSRIRDGLFLLAILAAFAVAVVALAIAAPLALAVSAVIGAMSLPRRRDGWRRARTA